MASGDTHRTCHRCCEVLPLSMFQTYTHSDGEKRTRRTCRLCRNTQARESEAKKREAPDHQEYLQQRRFQANYSRINSQYSLSKTEYEQMLKDQCGLCAICGNQESRTRNGKTLRLCIDHNAETGQIRGLLCSTCNVAIGMLGHDPVLVSAAVQYLLKYQQDDLGGQ